MSFPVGFMITASKKSHCFVFGAKNNDRISKYNLQNGALKLVDEVCDLGFLIGKSTTFDTH